MYSLAHRCNNSTIAVALQTAVPQSANSLATRADAARTCSSFSSSDEPRDVLQEEELDTVTQIVAGGAVIPTSPRAQWIRIEEGGAWVHAPTETVASFFA